MVSKSGTFQRDSATLVREGAVHSSRPRARWGARAFSEGEVVAGRYQVVRFLSEGSMGEVYAVEDLSLRERVALKTIRPEAAGTPEALERFKRELRLARRVTHPNVCRVFDIGTHLELPDEEGDVEAVTFLTMELLEGETLREHLARCGRLSPEEVLPLAEQMAAALDAAHAAQVIHRDFKSANVMRVPAPSAPGGQRVVVTDFGLALGEMREEEQEISRVGDLLGSPGYMSPEQVEGEPLSPASDLYAFGVVLFEMVTGRLPFLASTPVATALKRLREPPPSPCELVPGLGAVWERVLLRALARRPDERFTTACELVDALKDVHPAPEQAPVARRSVAVLDPRNLSGRGAVAWLSTALAEMLSAELAVGEQVRLLSGESVARMRQDLALPDEEGFAEDTLRRIRAWSGVDLVLTGSYLVLGREESAVVRLNLRLQDVATGETVLHLTETGSERELLELVSRSGASLRGRLGLSALTSEQVRGARNVLPEGTEAARLYAEGLAALRNHDAATAVQQLERVVERQSDFAPAWSALAAALKHLFQEARAKEAARRAFELSASLSREERLLVQARHHEAQAEWAQAIEAYQTLFEFFPDNVEYGTALVTAQVAAGQVREAQETLAALRRLPPPLGEDARLDLAAAVVSTAAGDFAASRRLAGEAVTRARQVDQGQLAAAALIQEAYAARNLGEPTQAVELLEESERLYLAGGDRGGSARAMLVRAVALVDMGRLRAAEVLFTVVLGVARELQGASLVGEILANAGGLSCHLGELEEALHRAREGLEVHQRLGMLADANICKLLLGKVQRHRGELEEARRLLEEAAQEAQVRFGDDYCEAWARYELGSLLFDRGELVESRRQLERSLALRQARGMPGFAAETELALARLAMMSREEVRLEEALALAERVRATHAVLCSREKEGQAHAVKARVLLCQGEDELAREALERARALAGESEDLLITSEVTLSEAVLVLQLGTDEERRAEVEVLGELATRAAQGGMKRVELAARFLRALLERDEDSRRAVEQEAWRLGFRMLTQRVGGMARG